MVPPIAIKEQIWEAQGGLVIGARLRQSSRSRMPKAGSRSSCPVSFVGTDDLIQEDGSDAEGFVVTQVVPPYYLTDYKGVTLYRRTPAEFYASAQPNFVSLEGFFDAMVPAEGLKKAGRELTRAKGAVDYPCQWKPSGAPKPFGVFV